MQSDLESTANEVKIDLRIHYISYILIEVNQLIEIDLIDIQIRRFLPLLPYFLFGFPVQEEV